MWHLMKNYMIIFNTQTCEVAFIILNSYLNIPRTQNLLPLEGHLWMQVMGFSGQFFKLPFINHIRTGAQTLQGLFRLKLCPDSRLECKSILLVILHPTHNLPMCLLHTRLRFEKSPVSMNAVNEQKCAVAVLRVSKLKWHYGLKKCVSLNFLSFNIQLLGLFVTLLTSI